MSVPKIVLVAATALEIPDFIPASVKETHQCGTLMESSSENDHVSVLITGPGTPATLFYLTRTLEHQRFDVAINAGIAGSFKEKFPIGSAVNVVNDGFSNLGAYHKERFFPFYEMEMAKPFKPDFVQANGMIPNNTSLKLSSLKAIPEVTGITVNTISNDLTDRIDADVESMEGAAFFWCCHMHHLPCLQLRTISNRIAPGHLSQWDIPTAVASLQNILQRTLDELK
jgi:futalosine hydrolase